ncbi:putative endolytic peptidoglycan transglycosylase RlpA [Candidatus Ornithobacterium hominis]|uniref:septal ring lytic transglycosylase RlpA family protein n=1 Tax=Candidatus Ornithobacterium hominis TaxID=2497989 RepID=UPI0024BD02E1|nr:septal ring lytic transglycosylase RlpA family protein [Candidatus Ornithobacterium hominis]CAI9428855.1 putative endolytic peptidoglycan transglycosylase RlpA [Candidatus Ornithobacterium hominis]
MKTLALSTYMIFNLLSAPSSVDEMKTESELKTAKVSWYGKKFHGKKTASGEIYNMYELTAANKKLPFGTRVKIINPKNGKEVIVTINDRGPYVGSRKFDLSKAAFEKIADPVTGVIRIQYEIL